MLFGKSPRYPVESPDISKLNRIHIRPMKLSKVSNTLVWLAVFGCAGMLYGVFALITGDMPAWEKVLPAFGILFLFGVWAGVVFMTEKLLFRRLLHSALFAAFGYLAAQVLADPTFEQLALVTVISAVVGYFGEMWVKHV